MGLDFTNIPDRDGLAIYCLHDGTVTQQRSVERLVDAVKQQVPHQIFTISAHDRDGEKIREFYNLDTGMFPHILLVNDEDQIVMSWSGGQMPTADVVAYTAKTNSEI
jgi:hypothetical protein